MALFNVQDQLTNLLLLYIIFSSCNLINASETARHNFGSIVKQVRSQSNDPPNFLNCR